jgi:transcriptional regulator with XRE-family HTH domain
MPVPNAEHDRVKLAERLRQSREYLELSQDEVARRVDLPRTAISMIESGLRRVEAIELSKFAEIYQRPQAYFTGERQDDYALPPEVEHLARTAKKLSGEDRAELARFAEFLSSRNRGKNKNVE